MAKTTKVSPISYEHFMANLPILASPVVGGHTMKPLAPVHYKTGTFGLERGETVIQDIGGVPTPIRITVTAIVIGSGDKYKTAKDAA